MLRSFFPILLMFVSACTMAEDIPQTVSVSGKGIVSAEPDRAYVQMTIMSRSRELDTAQAGAANVTEAVLALVDKLDIERSRVDTTGANVRPDYRWNRQKEQQELSGYIADRQMSVRVDDLDKLGKLVEGAIAAGVNQVSPPQLDSSRRAELHREALAAAAKDARANAQVLASTLGASLGDPISISDSNVVPAPPGPQLRAMEASARKSDAAATYNPGDLNFTATVHVVFQLNN